jgi:hypothetical protein
MAGRNVGLFLHDINDKRKSVSQRIGEEQPIGMKLQVMTKIIEYGDKGQHYS